MPENNQNLTYQELIRLLQRSTAAQNRRDDQEFSRQDLLDIAAQIGISEEVVLQMSNDHFRKRAEIETVPPPFGTRITIAADANSFDMKIPPLGLTGGGLFGMIFSVAWLGFVAFWTFFAAQGSFLFALFSLPFWVVGLGMVRGHIRKHFSTTTLHLDREGGILLQRPFGKRRKLLTPQLNATVATQQPGKNIRTSGAAPAKVVRLHHGVESYDLMEGFSDSELHWVENALRRWLL